MKIRLLLPALVPLLLGGCSNTVIVSATPYAIHATEASTISVALFSDNMLPKVQGLIHLTSKNTAAAAFPAVPVVLKTTVATGAASAVVTAGVVDHNTLVVMHAEWVHPVFNDSGDTTINVLPPVMDSPKIGDDYISVAPSVTPSWTYRYVITSHNSAGHSPPEITDCNMQFGVKVNLTVVSATNPSVPGITVTATETPGGSWELSGGATFQTLVVDVSVPDGSPGGTATITCREKTGSGWNSYIATPTGPQP